MIDASGSVMFRRFRERLMQERPELPSGSVGFARFAYMERGFASQTELHYAPSGMAFFAEGHPSAAVGTLFYDIPDDVSPDECDRASIVATYRVRDAHWSCWVACGDEAEEWRYDPGNIFDLAEKVSPL